MKHGKQQKQGAQAKNDRIIISPVRYRGLNKLFNLNLSRMLIKYPDSPFPKRESNIQNPEQIIVTSNNRSINKQSNELNGIKFSAQIKNKLTFVTKKKYSKKYGIDINRTDVFSEDNRKSIEKKNEQKSEILQEAEEESKNRSSFSTNFVQMHITEKKMHESSFEGKKGRKSVLKDYQQIKVIKKTHTHIKPRTKPSSKMILPDLKTEKKVQTQPKYIVPVLTRDPDELRNIKSDVYVIWEYPTSKLIMSYRGNNPYEIASLTKIMTFYTVRKICMEYAIDCSKESVVVEDHIMEVTGTSAELLGGEIYTIEELLYGLMLPSGNDAAICLAEWGGRYLTMEEQSKARGKAFINEMNKNCKELNLFNTRFGNPHGLPHPDSRSTAIQVAKLSSMCLNDALFVKVVNTKEFKCNVVTCSNIKREVVWTNTNKLLRREGFIGIKTGITVTAGPCLATAYRFRDKVYITVIMRANKISRRFKQTRKLLSWALEKLHKGGLKDAEVKKLNCLRRNKPDLDSDYSEDENEFNYDISDPKEFKKRCNIINYQM